jgi:hypothetical protein
VRCSPAVLLDRCKVRRYPGPLLLLFCCSLFPSLDAVCMVALISSLSVRAHDAPPLPLSRARFCVTRFCVARFCGARRALWRGFPRAPRAPQSPDVLDQLVLAVHGLADHVLELQERGSSGPCRPSTGRAALGCACNTPVGRARGAPAPRAGSRCRAPANPSL